ncbi:EPS15 homologyprotein [Actinidia chinensis var. chinensis]|uniref:EPS15 homologyprotein n=1 Tax=Actinidia chinensis var. chinensis TaxID=1590841 RepID=A0A2R6Q1V3_ACTCC|nr:EPS15 homologyprotein [Actinidia chinensis var. chinensis]
MAGQNIDLFDAYFRRADSDRDGRISGGEAVAFFQGANLPQQVLAQIWMHANQHKTGFLGRAEFYNALKLVTVAQSKRELTPDIVKAALYGPASAKIPAPQINFAATAASPSNPTAGTTVPPVSGVTPVSSQNIGVRGPHVSANASMGQQFFPSQQNQMGKPPRPMPPGSAFRPQQGVASQGMPGIGTIAASHPSGTNVSTDWLGERTVVSAAGVTAQVPNRGITPPTTQDAFGMTMPGITTSAQPRPNATAGLLQPSAPKPNDPTFPSSHVGTSDSKSLAVSGNGFASDSVFGDVFSVTKPQPKQDTPSPASSASDLLVSSGIVPPSTGPQPTVKPSPLGSLQSVSAQQSVGSHNQQVQSNVKGNQQVSGQSLTAFSSAGTGFPVGGGNAVPGQSQVPWPRMTQSDVQKYTKVFVEVDRDRDGKITGAEARNLFLSWRLPREVLKQVWDLSDQDNDSMLSLREFCIALYLMERYREGRPLPKTLPSGIMFDETMLPASGQAAAAAYGSATWRPPPGSQQARVMPGAQPATHAARARPPNQVSVPLAEEAMQPAQQKSKVPVLEKHLVNQLSEEEQNTLNLKFQEATEANKKVEELEKEILDSREKTEFYRSKMQEIVSIFPLSSF